MKYCGNCGGKLSDGSLFCTECGNRVAQDNSNPAQNAGTYNPDNIPQAQSYAQKRKLSLLEIIGYTFSAIVFLIGLAFMISSFF